MGQVGSQICGFLKGGAGPSGPPQVELSPQSYVPVYAVPPVQPVAGAQVAVAPVAVAIAPGAVATAHAHVAVATAPVATAPVAVAQAHPPTGQAMAVASAVPSPDSGISVAKTPAATSVAYGTPVTGMACAQAVPCGQPMAMGMPLSATGVVAATPVEVVSQAVPLDLPTQPRVQLPGKRKSVLVGINYFGSDGELGGCIADVKRMMPLLAQQGFPSDEEHQLVLLDDHNWPALRRPTLANMRKAIRWLTHDVQTGQALNHLATWGSFF